VGVSYVPGGDNATKDKSFTSTIRLLTKRDILVIPSSLLTIELTKITKQDGKESEVSVHHSLTFITVIRVIKIPFFNIDNHYFTVLQATNFDRIEFSSVVRHTNLIVFKRLGEAAYSVTRKVNEAGVTATTTAAASAAAATATAVATAAAAAAVCGVR
jgi:hypothetical protein